MPKITFFLLVLLSLVAGGCAPLLSLVAGGCAPLVEEIPSWDEVKREAFFWREPQTAPRKPVEPVAHELWCYKTLGEVDCYTKPQDTLPERFVGTYPKGKTPIDRAEHERATEDQETLP